MQAIVTVNLTSLLVLTTLFISVSSSLPQTAYVKMVDVWLIFAQLVPWIEVLLHTLIDWMRTDEDSEEGREVNHHGKTITIGGNAEKDKVKLIGKLLIHEHVIKNSLCGWGVGGLGGDFKYDKHIFCNVPQTLRN